MYCFRNLYSSRPTSNVVHLLKSTLDILCIIFSYVLLNVYNPVLNVHHHFKRFIYLEWLKFHSSILLNVFAAHTPILCTKMLRVTKREYISFLLIHYEQWVFSIPYCILTSVYKRLHQSSRNMLCPKPCTYIHTYIQCSIQRKACNAIGSNTIMHFVPLFFFHLYPRFLVTQSIFQLFFLSLTK